MEASLLEKVFLKAANLSITAGWIVLAVLLLRLVFRKAPKWITCLLWGLVAIRLACPFSIESVLSVIPSSKPLPDNIVYTATPFINSGVSSVDRTVNSMLMDRYLRRMEEYPLNSVNPTQIWAFVFSHLWMIGIVIMLAYALLSFVLLKYRMATATMFEKGIKQSERVQSPFVLGVFRPVIYVPYHLEKEDLKYVIAHEKAHIARKDHWWKPIGFLLLSVYWFNPLLWVAYATLCRDIEAACDEKVIKSMEKEERRAYSSALLHCSVHRKWIAACPLAFGEVSVKDRVKSVMNYNKPAFWIVVLALVITIMTAVCLLTSPVESNAYRIEGKTVKWFDFLESGADMKLYSELETSVNQVPGVIFRWTANKIEAITEEGTEVIITGEPIWNAYFCDSNGDGKPELYATCGKKTGEVSTGVVYHNFETGYRGGYVGKTSDYALRYDEKSGLLYTDIYEHNGNEQVAEAVAFLENYHEPLFSEDNLEHAITNTIMEQNGFRAALGYIEVESHKILDIEEKKDGKELTVYALVLHLTYGPQEEFDGELKEDSGSYIPTAITFYVDEYGNYTLKEYWIPRDGRYYAQDIRKKFPLMAQLEVWNAQDYVEDLEAECQRKVIAVIGKAESYDWTIFDYWLEEKFNAVHDAIPTNISQTPCAYFAEQFPEEYATLTAKENSEYVLHYCFRRFLQGDVHDYIEGCLMEKVCQDIIMSRGEAFIMENPAHGSEWFKAFEDNALKLYEQYSTEQYNTEYFEKYYPASYLLLKMKWK